MAADYVELHCHSAYSFLDGVAQPEELVDRAVALGYDALAPTRPRPQGCSRSQAAS